MNNNIKKAIDFAQKQHKGQFRKGDKIIPYIVHPLNVGNILERTGNKDKVIIAGILHDVVEDTDTTVQFLSKKFGKTVAKLVESVTEKGEGLTWRERLNKYLQKVDLSTPDTKAIVAADKIDNMSSMTEALNNGYDIFKNMRAGKSEQIKKFKEVYNVISKDLSLDLQNLYQETLQNLISVAEKTKFN